MIYEIFIERFTFCLIVCRFESSITVEECLAGELWLRCGFWIIFDDWFVIHVQDFVDVDIELEEDDDILRVSVVIGVFDGQSTHEVEWRKSVGSDLNKNKITKWIYFNIYIFI
jgi:hypothetical protein